MVYGNFVSRLRLGCYYRKYIQDGYIKSIPSSFSFDLIVGCLKNCLDVPCSILLWRLREYSFYRVDRGAAYYSDSCTVVIIVSALSFAATALLLRVSLFPHLLLLLLLFLFLLLWLLLQIFCEVTFVVAVGDVAIAPVVNTANAVLCCYSVAFAVANQLLLRYCCFVATVFVNFAATVSSFDVAVADILMILLQLFP